MFLRFVPIFTVGGSMCGCVARGTVIGMGLFFVLMAADSLSLLTWDVHHIIPEGFKAIRHATNVAMVLYLFGGFGALASVAAGFALRQNKHHMCARYTRLSLQALIAVQLSLVIELGYTSLQQFTGAGRHHAGMMTTLKITPHRTHHSR